MPSMHTDPLHRPDSGLRILWKLLRLTPDWASVRIRTLIPACGLEASGHTVLMGDEMPAPEEITAADIVIINKSFTETDRELAVLAKAAGKPVVVDLCDNIFVDGYGGDTDVVEGFRRLVPLVDMIVTTNPALAERIAAEPDCRDKMQVIEDGYDFPWSPGELDDFVLEPSRRYRRYTPNGSANPPAGLTRIRRRLMRWKNSLRFHIYRLVDTVFHGRMNPARRTVVWFGNRGAAHGGHGMVSLRTLLPALSAANEQIPLQLLVISRGFFHFREVVAEFPFPCHFRRWEADRCHHLIATADVCVIPNPDDGFSRYKSANRALVALMQGVPVVADRAPALASLKEFILMDDPGADLPGCLADPVGACTRIAPARAVIEKRYGQVAIAAHWEALIRSLTDSAGGR